LICKTIRYIFMLLELFWITDSAGITAKLNLQ